MTTRVALIAGAVLVLVSAGTVAGLVATRAVRPAVLSEPTAVEQIEPTPRDYDDARTVDLRVDRGEPIAVTVPVSGRVTGWQCRPGTELRSGEVALTVNGQPVLALATEVPLWRDLRLGDEGADAAAVQQALVDLGEEVTIDGRVGPTTTAALDRVRDRAAAGTPAAHTIDPATLLWLPSSVVRVGECTVDLGESVTAGQTVAETTGSVVAVRLAREPADAVPGARVVEVDGVVAALGGEGITDPDSLAALTATESVSRHLADPEAVPLTMVWRLEEPLRVSAVPPGAVFGLEGTSACVAEHAQPIQVHVVASELGQTLVTFSGRVPEVVDVLAPAGLTCP